MGQQVCTGAVLTCSFGTAPSTLTAIPKGVPVLAGGPLAANINDHLPIANIPPFALGQSLANPTVASATAAAQGILTPMPCVPVIPAPWAPGSPTVLIDGAPALTSTCQCACAWG